MSKEDIIRKICSRKFISLLVAIINDIVVMATIGYSPETLTEMVTVTVACIGYMFSEGKVDAANASSSTTAINVSTTSKETADKVLGTEG